MALLRNVQACADDLTALSQLKVDAQITRTHRHTQIHKYTETHTDIKLEIMKRMKMQPISDVSMETNHRPKKL